jgi:hypothetical protein
MIQKITELKDKDIVNEQIHLSEQFGFRATKSIFTDKHNRNKKVNLNLN